MALLSIAELRSLVESDLTDAALQMMLDATEAEITRKLGDLSTETLQLDGGDAYLHLGRRASSITSVSEYYTVECVGYTTTVLVAGDYSLSSDGWRIERKVDGTNPSPVWLGLVTVDYVPVSSIAERKLLQAKLIKLDLAYQGMAEQRVGDMVVREEADHSAARAAIFKTVTGLGGRLIS